MHQPPQPGAFVPAPGQMSADGHWQWNGFNWVPNVAAAGPYRSARTRSRWAAGLLGVGAFAALLLLIAQVGRLTLANRILAGDFPTRAEVDASDAFVQQANLGVLVLLVGTGIAMLMWLHRVVANNHSLGATGLRFTPRWAVGWWFVPVASLVRPEQVVEEAWRSADPTLRNSSPDSRNGVRPPILVRTWWGIWILAGFIALIASLFPRDTIAALRDATNAQVAAVTVRIVAAVLAIAVVLMLTVRQERSAIANGTQSTVPGPFGSPPPPPPPPPAAL